MGRAIDRFTTVAADAGSRPVAQPKVLIVDLNIFASFPTMAIGLLAASMRNAGLEVDVLAPLAFDAPASQRERQERFHDHVMRRIHLSDHPRFRAFREAARSLRREWIEKSSGIVMREVRRALDRQPDVVLLSAYLRQYESVQEIAKAARQRGIPVILGGPMFNVGRISENWRAIEGLTAIVGAEMDRDIAGFVRAAISGDNLLAFRGVTLPDGTRSVPAAPLRKLDDTPIPDYRDFPWDRYPNRIVPIMSGRGCQWDKCRFCSDVISVSGRTFRTRSVESVLLEMQEQARRHATSNFLFLDLKLNSWPDMIRGIAQRIQRLVPGAEWIGTVHVDQREDNGLSKRDLDMAADGGLRRVSFGLESGSQRILDAANKGCNVERNSQFLREAHDAGLSLRCTMFKGYPGETAEDMEATADFLEQHAQYIDRIRFNDFTLMPDTPVWDDVNTAGSEGAFEIERLDDRRGNSRYRNRQAKTKAYRKAKARALRTVYEINRQPLRDSARQFDGLM
ncbi:radical SAM protein [Erythrobacter litoralis]|uniref:B12-binding domain-containing radical SAM protein n=1 Tax=Erythrobacter litoralis TaxID=39960 RepID=UPI002435CEAC|nr:radical SAM protein [Erythrobacter litoralis]MDG6079004.1 radical SAM protein [Erythrobacter litoralis]